MLPYYTYNWSINTLKVWDAVGTYYPLDLVEQAADLNRGYNNPILVHCSAGVGRSAHFTGCQSKSLFYKIVRRNLKFVKPSWTSNNIFINKY